MAEDCGCGKGTPPPLGGKPRPEAGTMVASIGGGGFTHVAPNGVRTTHPDLLGAQAAVARSGGRIET